MGSHIVEYLRVPSMRRRGHRDEHIPAVVVRRRGLRVQNEGHGQEAFDPFDELVPTVGLERVLDAVTRCHFRWRGD